MAGRIVVGVDGSPASVAAVRWANEEAARRGAELEVIHAWSYPYLIPRTGTHEPRELMALDAAKVLEETVSEALGDGAAVPVKAHLVEGRPSEALAESAAGADLLVIGATGHLLSWGSVANEVVRSAPCPVTVVPA